MTRILQIFTRTLESVKIGTLIRSFCTKKKMHELQIYSGVVCHENESDTKIQEELTCRFEIDMNFTNFDPST